MHSKPFALVAAGAIALLIAAGCAKSSDQSSTTTTTKTSSDTAAPAAATAAAQSGGSSMTSTTTTTTTAGDAVHGKQIFTANCSGCHGTTGVEGGVGPSLKGEKANKDTAATIAWIHNPRPPMPKLWPSPLGDKDVADVAAYVQSL